MKRFYSKVRSSIFSAISVVVLLLIISFGSAAQKYLPPPGKTLLIIGQDLASVSDYQNVTSLPALGGVTSYASLYDVANPLAYYPYGGLGEKLDGTVAPDINWGAGPLNTHNAAYGFSNATLALGLYMTEDFFPGGLTQIANGTYDTEINRLATFLAATNKPVFLRIGYEFDGNWNTGYSNTTNYKNAYKHIVDLIRAKGTNTMMVWQACTSPVDDIIENTHENISDWYPGDNYVDYMGYSWFLNTPLQFSLTDEVIALARAKGKPVMACESTPQGYDLKNGTYRYINTMLGGAPGTNPVSKTPNQIWDEWFKPYFKYIHDNSDVIKVVAYINANWDAQAKWASPYPEGYWGDSRIQANATIQQKWIDEVSTSFWLNGSSSLFNTLLNTGTTGNTAPIVTFTSPTSTALTKGSSLLVKVTATDDDVVTGVTLSLNGSVLRKITTAPYTWGVNAVTDPSLFNLAVGTYILKVEATDQNSHTSTATYTVSVTDPTAPPVIGSDFAPEVGKTLVLIGQTYRAEYDHYVNATNKAPAGSSHYAQLYNGKIDQGDDGNNEAFLKYINTSYPLAYAELAISIKDNPAMGGYTGENAVWKACKDIPTGKWDAQIDMIAASIKAKPTVKFLVRIGYEVNLNMFANKTTTPFIDILNKYTALGINPLEKADQIPEFDLQAYKDAYNYIAQRIRTTNKVTNAAFIFHPVRGINDAKMLYPGDANVDWFGLSIFNHDICWPTWEGNPPPFRNCPETQAMDDNVRQCMEWAKNTIKKPIIIAESASQSDVVHQGTAAFQNGYLDKVFNLIKTYDIKAFVYINSDWTSHGWSSQWGDSRVEKDPAVLSHWLAEVLKPRYIHYPQTVPTKDCAGVANGAAKLDACLTCVGGTTGKVTLDTDNDGTADCVDTDDDNDGVLDADDCAPLDKNIKGKTMWYADTDGDGFGDPAVTQLACTKPTGYVADKTDACPTDPNKKVAGNCGCNKIESSCLDC
ncbi:glycosyl hydrolase, partial [uncultured Cytophaga sp.]|uniref:glycosyl hydrolase n=1 Tax=uncultured Cytophaga sp. TaxID=160238 RepID=UPI00260CE699